MPNYSRGDVVLVHFKFDETNETKLRPVVILEDLEKETLNCYITSNLTRATTTAGFKVLKNSDEAKQMGLRRDSFVDASRTITTSKIMIEGKIGTCPFIDDLEDLTNKQ